MATKSESGREKTGKAGTRRSGHGWGGRRPGAGRKPKGRFAEAAHVPRPTLPRNAHVLITLELVPGLSDLCAPGAAEVVDAALRESDGRFGVILHGRSLHREHLHLFVRARDRQALSRAMLSLCVRTARALNGYLGRKGRVFAQRYEGRVLRNERELREARRSPCSWRNAPDVAGPNRPATCAGAGAQAAPGRGKRARLVVRLLPSRRRSPSRASPESRPAPGVRRLGPRALTGGGGRSALRRAAR